MPHALKIRSKPIIALALAALAASLMLVIGAGSASASPEKLSWSICGTWGGEGEFKDLACTDTSAGFKPYSWGRPGNSSNYSTKTSSTSNYKIDWSLGGINYKVQCYGAEGNGKLKNTTTGAEIKEYQLVLTGCWLIAPVSYCVIPGNTITIPLQGKSPEGYETLDPVINMVVTSETGFTLEKCKAEGLNGYYSLSGGFPLRVHSDSTVTTDMIESYNQLKIKGANNGEIEGASTIRAHAKEFLVKLVTGP